MNAWYLRAPWWKLSLVMGALLAPFFTVMFRLGRDMGWAAAVPTGLLTAAICGPILGYMAWKQAHESISGAGSLPEDHLARAERAARRGAVPQEDELRQAALGIVEHRLLMLHATRVRALVSTASLLVVAVLLAVSHSPWWWMGVGFGLALLAFVLWTPAHLERRAQLLRRLDRG
jgi:hypothetical protein